MTRRVVAWSGGVVLVLLYAYLVIAAVGNLMGMHEMAGQMGLHFTAVGWFWLVLGIALPVAALMIALLTGRRRTAGARLILLALGVCVVAAFQLEIMHLVPQSTFFAA